MDRPGGPFQEALVGVISDTHGLLRPQAIRALEGVHHIVHGGDVGNPEILRSLASLAPVTAVRGNTDWGEWAAELSETEVLELSGATLFVLHDLEALDLDPRAAGFDVVVSGHTHDPEIREDGGVLYLNPGSAGPVRGQKPITLAKLRIRGGTIVPRIIPLQE